MSCEVAFKFKVSLRLTRSWLQARQNATVCSQYLQLVIFVVIFVFVNRKSLVEIDQKVFLSFLIIIIAMNSTFRGTFGWFEITNEMQNKIKLD